MTATTKAFLVIGILLAVLIFYFFSGPTVVIVVPAEPFSEGFR